MDRSRGGVSVPDHRGIAAKRQGGGSGGRIWRDGIADGVRAARVGDAVIEGDHHFGGIVHDYVVVAIDHGDSECGIGDDGIGDGTWEDSASSDEVGANAGTDAVSSADGTTADAATGSGAGRPGDTGEEVAFLNAEVAELADALA